MSQQADSILFEAKLEPELIQELGLFGISRGQGVRVPNLLGVRREEPEQVRESDMSSTQTPKDPTLNEPTEVY